MRRTSILALLAAASALMPAGGSVDQGIVDVLVTFDVVNKNDSKVPCEADGLPYRVRGDLVAPRGPLESGRLTSVTVYVHGAGNGSSWHFKALPGYDYAASQADAGHASVVIDLLGYGRSDWPNGLHLCVGSLADTLSQIVGKLRSGDYQIGEGTPVAFQRIALAGHSFGGYLAQIDAYSFHDIDALIVVGISDALWNPLTANWLYRDAARAGSRCAQGGDPKKQPGDPEGYAYTFKKSDDDPAPNTDKLFFGNGEPAVMKAFAAAWERDVCAAAGLAVSVALDQVLLATVTVPVLVVYGEHERRDFFLAADAQHLRYGSFDRTTAVIPDSGHALMLERTRESFRALMSAWLSTRGF